MESMDVSEGEETHPGGTKRKAEDGESGSNKKQSIQEAQIDISSGHLPIPDTFMKLHQVLDICKNAKNLLSEIPQGVKTNVYFVLEDAMNALKREMNEYPRYNDDCGDWNEGRDRGFTRSFYIHVNKGVATCLKQRGNIFYKDKHSKGGSYTQPYNPQPDLSEVIRVYRRIYANPRRAGKKRITAVSGGGLKSMALIEYTGRNVPVKRAKEEKRETYVVKSVPLPELRKDNEEEERRNEERSSDIAVKAAPAPCMKKEAQNEGKSLSVPQHSKPVHEAKNDVTTVKRPRGRPRIHKVHNNVIKRPVGRPRLPISLLKRPRGRPPGKKTIKPPKKYKKIAARKADGVLAKETHKQNIPERRKISTPGSKIKREHTPTARKNKPAVETHEHQTPTGRKIATPTFGDKKERSRRSIPAAETQEQLTPRSRNISMSAIKNHEEMTPLSTPEMHKDPWGVTPNAEDPQERTSVSKPDFHIDSTVCIDDLMVAEVLEENRNVQELIHRKSKPPCVILYTEEQFRDMKRNLECEGVLGVDCTHKFGDCYLTMTVYQNARSLHKATNEPLLFLGPAFLHWDREFTTYVMFFSHVVKKLEGIKLAVEVKLGDDIGSLFKALKFCFPASSFMLDCYHLREALRGQLLPLLSSQHKVCSTVLDYLFGDTGIIYSSSLPDFDTGLSTLTGHFKDFPSLKDYLDNLRSILYPYVCEPLQRDMFQRLWVNGNDDVLNAQLNTMLSCPENILPEIVKSICSIINMQMEELGDV